MKNMKNIILLLILLLLAKNLSAQKFIVISGQVSDSLSNEPLAGANVNLNYGEQNAITDKAGKFTVGCFSYLKHFSQL